MDYNNYVVKGIMKPGRDLFVSEVHRDVVDSYLDDVFLRVSLLKLMIAYDRFNPASRVLTALLRDRASLDYKSITIMDYGCGAADYAILFACFGCDVVVVDIEGAPIDLACFGLKKHSISRYSRNQRYPYPELPQVDIINATEVLEHVIDPPLMIERFAGALRRNGYLTFSDYSRRPKSVGGSHLQIAANKREQTLSTLNRFFVEIWADPSAGHLYKKI